MHRRQLGNYALGNNSPYSLSQNPVSKPKNGKWMPVNPNPQICSFVDFEEIGAPQSLA
jgi:hypothetical protein